LLLESIFETPGLVDRLFQVLRSEPGASEEESHMTWESFYLLCFLAGFFFSLVSFLAGFGLSTCPECIRTPAHGSGGRRSQTSPINFGTVAAFLAWFGGVGYLLSAVFRASSRCWRWRLAIVSGLIGAAIVFLVFV
jgi:hypothetical protein